jgi:signal transduction histidine kinase
VRSPLVYRASEMSRLWAFGRRYVVDVLIVLVFVAAALELAFGGDDPGKPDEPLWISIPVVGLLILPLLAWRRFPFAAPAWPFLAGAATSFTNAELVSYTFAFFIAVIGCAFLFGMLQNRLQARIGLAIAIAAVGIVVRNDPTGGREDFFFVSLVMVIAWLAGYALSAKLQEVEEARERARALERGREEQAHTAVAEERARIARELHDIVGHSVSVMTVQAGAVRRLLTADQTREREALLVVEETGRQALTEMRRLVDVLRRPEEAPALAPQPSLEFLDKLVAQVREAGLPVELRIEGKPAKLPPGIDLTAYRLVQEGLTNALKHAGAHQAEVVVRYGAGEVVLQVSDDGVGEDGGPGEDGGGQGLVGLRERISVYGGVLEAGRQPGGGFALHARLPLN